MRGPAWRALLLVVALAVVDLATARFVVEKNSLQVTSPDELKGKYECAIGNFGVPQYGGTLHGWVQYPKSNRKACQSFDQFDISFKPKAAGGRPNFVLLDRGDSVFRKTPLQELLTYPRSKSLLCYAYYATVFTTKAWNAQNAGAAAVLVVDDKDEPLITMDNPEEGKEHLENITIPSVLIKKELGDKLKKSAENADMLSVLLDWRESLPHPDERVEYEFWTNSNDECGSKCDMQMDFVRSFRGTAQVLEKKDPEQDFSEGYDGKDVVVQNLHQICVFKIANETGKPWLWWDYVHDFALRCPMKDKKYTPECAHDVIKSLGLDLEMINKCVGDPDANEDNEILKAEQDAQDTFRGRVCECPIVKGVKFVGDGYTNCEASGIGRCEINNGGCWKETKHGKTISACLNEQSEGCKCPAGFRGDGVKSCEGKKASTAPVGWSFLWVIFFGLLFAGVGAYAVYKYRLRSYMDSEIRAIMAQYMPLDNQEGANQHHVAHAEDI
ncbi:hypothetical protein PR202_gb19788 [Eleusine coracana subsp. coracana]|uniref:Uncharacterized protein n=1 Tax=Eleusine coracana subsp. coracana TaxID=191504 RepID=A0AAV5F6V3_ELECO|nr:hypothetical protein PR202_gb19788 [Eleusine coracana subsp. coracana]